MNYLEKLRNKSDAVKMRIAYGGAITVTVIIVFLWLLASGFLFPRATGSGEKPEGLFKILFGSRADTKPVDVSGEQSLQVVPVTSPKSDTKESVGSTDVFGGEQVFIEEQGSTP